MDDSFQDTLKCYPGNINLVQHSSIPINTGSMAELEIVHSYTGS